MGQPAPAVGLRARPFLAADLRGAALDRAPDGAAEHVGSALLTLDEVLLRPGLDRGERAVGVLVAAQHDDRRPDAGRVQALEALQSIGVGQGEIEEDAVGVLLGEIERARR
jgi:hypothetical protein